MSDDPYDMRPMLLEEFTPLIGRTFKVDAEPKEIEIELIEAYSLTDRGVTDRPPFILIFRTGPETMLVDGSYRMRCGNWGPDRIAIWGTTRPNGAEPGYHYQAVFN